MTNLFEQLIDGMQERGYGVADAFLDAAEVSALRQQLHNRYEAGQFRAAAVGNKQVTVEKQIRGDEIMWLDAATATPAEATYLNRIDALRTYLNQTCYLGLLDAELHYARYPIGTFYQRHLDRFRSDSRRKLSLITYLNEHWQPTDGGQLLIYQPERGTTDGSEEAARIDPVGGRIVCFDSGLLEHEVLPATRDRLSITGWLRTA
jgi:SM-20-related protein